MLDLPTDRLRPPVQSFRGATVTRRLDADLTRGLKRLAAAADATLFMTLLAAYQVLLHRYTMQDDILVGSPTADRHRDELTGLVGDFVNMVALRADFRGGPTFRQLLVQTRPKVVGAIQHQDYPFSLVVDRLQPARDLSRTPIFQTTFALQKFQRFPESARARFAGEDEPEIPFAGLVLEPIPFVDQEGQYDLNLEMKEDDRGRLVGAWKYDANLFEPDTVARLAGHFEDLLREIVAQPDRPVAALRSLTAEESRAVIAGGRGPRWSFPGGVGLRALRSPDRAERRCGRGELRGRFPLLRRARPSGR